MPQEQFTSTELGNCLGYNCPDWDRVEADMQSVGDRVEKCREVSGCVVLNDAVEKQQIQDQGKVVVEKIRTLHTAIEQLNEESMHPTLPVAGLPTPQEFYTSDNFLSDEQGSNI